MKKLDVLIRKLYALSVIAHVAHVNTRSFAQHQALGEFYDKVNDMKDRLIEYLMGENKIVKVEAAILECGGDVIAEADSVSRDFIEITNGDEALENMAGEFEEAVGKLKFLFLLK